LEALVDERTVELERANAAAAAAHSASILRLNAEREAKAKMIWRTAQKPRVMWRRFSGEASVPAIGLQ
jgi:hypothetical protein